MNNIGIYIHIPFCASKCPYCDFYSFKPTENQMDSYVTCVIDRVEFFAKKLKRQVDTIYFGGGTPSFFGGERIGKILSSINNSFHLVNPEITVECNPSSVDEKLMYILSESSVNRISMGMQSAVTKERIRLGRRSDSDSVFRAVDLAKANGMKNISLDLMLGVPLQTMESLDESIEAVIEAGVMHISAYMLKIEENTPFFSLKNTLPLPDEDTVCEMYLHTIDKLAKNSFNQYEISNFAKGGFESRHNLKYWLDEEYIGIGPSAHSFLDGKRFYYPRDFDSFLSQPKIVDDGDAGDEEEFMMLRFRLARGLRNDDFFERFNKNIDEKIFLKAKPLEKAGLLKITKDSISLTPKGFLLSNSVIGELII